jgi:hypothetical protein
LHQIVEPTRRKLLAFRRNVSIPPNTGLGCHASPDLPLEADKGMRMILGLIPAAERARLEAIADGDKALMNIGLGQWLGRLLGPCGDVDVPSQGATQSDVDDDADGIVGKSWRWLRDRVPTVH